MIVLLNHAHNSVRRRAKLHRCAILSASESPWQRLYYHGDSSSFLLMTGLTRIAFHILLNTLFTDNNQQPNVLRVGKPDLLDPVAQLGLYLFFIGSAMGIKPLCLIFGVTPTICSNIIYKMIQLVVKKLKNHPLDKVKFPDEEKMAYFAQLIQAREPKVDDAIGFMDGLALTSECTSEWIEQNAMYNGRHSDMMVNNIIAYGPDGKVFLCTINFPGCWHDGSITENILPHIHNNIGNYKMCVDQGFPRSGDAHLILVGPISTRQVKKLATNMRPYMLRISNIYTYL